MKEAPVRKSIRLKKYDYSNAGYYFVTICVKGRHEMLGKAVVGATVPGRPCVSRIELSELGKHVDSAIAYYNANGIADFNKYVIMPNHIHLIIVIGAKTGDRRRSPLQGIVRNLKSYVTKQAGFSPWQKSFHDHIIRDETEYLKICQYIDDNPARWQEDCYYNE